MQEYIYPKSITEDMLTIAQVDDPFHTVGNLNAMLEHGYCNTCGLVPSGCQREGCVAKAKEIVNNALEIDIDENQRKLDSVQLKIRYLTETLALHGGTTSLSAIIDTLEECSDIIKE